MLSDLLPARKWGQAGFARSQRPWFQWRRLLMAGLSQVLAGGMLFAQEGAEGSLPAGVQIQEVSLASPSVFDRMLDAGPVVSLVLFLLVAMSVITWAIFVAKWLYLRRVEKHCEAFIKSFWDSRSLNDLNSRLLDYPYSPVREVFRNGYAELVRGSQMKDGNGPSELAISVAIDNLTRTLQKSRQLEKRQLERFLPILAVSASACPFIGLFGTVWGIISAFEGIARTGSSSLAAVAPGISEALIATAFGLAAAIPAVVGYNIAAHRIRSMMAHLDGFGYDFLNIVERYLFSDRGSRGRPQGQPGQSAEAQTPGI